jgi:hypothetical protein
LWETQVTHRRNERLESYHDRGRGCYGVRSYPQYQQTIRLQRDVNMIMIMFMIVLVLLE